MSESILSQSHLKSLLHYCPDTGIFTWKNPGTGRRKLLIAGSVHNRTGYVGINICGKFITTHRLAFLYMEGDLPPNEVDHKNHIRDDNRWCNIRRATRSENQRNRSIARNNTSGVAGVNWNSQNNKWQARMQHNGKRMSSHHDDWFDAVCARKSLEVDYGF